MMDIWGNECRPWKCLDCYRFNEAVNRKCYWCFGENRGDVYPVEVANAQQGTPSIEELEADIKLMEAERADCAVPLAEQIDDLISRHQDEIGKLIRQKDNEARPAGRDRLYAEKWDLPNE